MPQTILGGVVNRKLKDRWEAIRRTKNYRLDRDTAFHVYVDRQKKELPKEELEQEFDCSPEGQEIARKWGLEFPFDYDDPVWNPEETDLPPVFRDPQAVHVIPHAPSKLKPITDEEGIIDRAPHLEAERYLTLKIDLTKPKGQIFTEIDYYYEDYISFALPGKKKKVKGNSVDDFYWKVWDMHHKQGKKPWQITKELYPDITSRYPQDCDIDENTGNLPPEAKQARSYLRKVERALEKAQKAIDLITPDA